MRNLGTTRIASRDVTVIGIQPKDGFRFAHELYIDHETGLLLKSLLVDESRELLERFQFTTISFDEENYSSGLEPGESCREVSVVEPPAGVDVPFWEPQWIPPGFTLGERQIQSINGDGPYVSSQIYSDGLTSFTLFVEPLGRDKLAEDLRARLGPTVAVSRRLMADSDVYLATVVGEIPPRAAERGAESLSEAVVGARRCSRNAAACSRWRAIASGLRQCAAVPATAVRRVTAAASRYCNGWDWARGRGLS